MDTGETCPTIAENIKHSTPPNQTIIKMEIEKKKKPG